MIFDKEKLTKSKKPRKPYTRKLDDKIAEEAQAIVTKLNRVSESQNIGYIELRIPFLMKFSHFHVQEREEEQQRSILQIEAQSWENAFQSAFERIVPKSSNSSVIVLPINEEAKQWEIFAGSK